MKKEKFGFSNLDKLYWPDEKITKGNLIEYYREMAAHIIPHLKNRPLSLKRNPNGILDEGFYQKNAGEIAPAWMKTADVLSDSTHKIIHYLICNDSRSLLFIANLGCIEMNPWNSTFDKPDQPDWLVIDIDPSEKNSFEQVIDVALVIKEILDSAGMIGYPKTSGASGMHVYIPLHKKYEYAEARDFGKLIAMLAQEQLPSISTLERSLSKRKRTQIYIDYLQNSRGQTLASAYSVRPRPGATVSTPLEWKEVKHGLQPLDFTIKNIKRRVEKKGDLFRPVLGKGIDMHAALRRLEKVHI